MASPTIRHIAIFSENPTELAKFYGDVFGIGVTGVDDLGNAWVTDGYMDIALLRRRYEKAPPVGINHWGFTVDAAEKPALYARMKKYGIEPYSPYVDAPEAHRPYAEDAVKDPDGNRFDVSSGMREVRAGIGQTDAAGAQTPKIKHIALFSDNTARLAEFYGEVFGMTVTGESKGDVWVTDGYVDFALLSRKRATAPRGGGEAETLSEPDRARPAAFRSARRGPHHRPALRRGQSPRHRRQPLRSDDRQARHGGGKSAHGRAVEESRSGEIGRRPACGRGDARFGGDLSVDRYCDIIEAIWRSLRWINFRRPNSWSI
jgi:predicted enzyme related to lactoylglutathione lyase